MYCKFLIQARIGSTRFPQKILTDIYNNLNLIDIVYNRLLVSKKVNTSDIVVLTTNNEKDNILVNYLKNNNIEYYRGDEKNVHGRFYKYLLQLNPKPQFFFRICADNPFIEPLFIDEMFDFIKKDKNNNIDYISYHTKEKLPAILTHYGFFCEMIKYDSFIDSLKFVNEYCVNNNCNDYKEHVTPAFYKTKYFNSTFLEMPEVLNKKNLRLTFDSAGDYEVVKLIYNKLNTLNFNYLDVLKIIDGDKKLIGKMKKNIIQNTKQIN
ncbi:MAG: hypothetical protein WC223_05310 [Bacteroidales bacterium]|jgi:spore coat polysaccharide biosynthesis protein SpsF (cytidylyltransferase family)